MLISCDKFAKIANLFSFRAQPTRDTLETSCAHQWRLIQIDCSVMAIYLFTCKLSPTHPAVTAVSLSWASLVSMQLVFLWVNCEVSSV